MSEQRPLVTDAKLWAAVYGAAFVSQFVERVRATSNHGFKYSDADGWHEEAESIANEAVEARKRAAING